jgi:hypothetical protein
MSTFFQRLFKFGSTSPSVTAGGDPYSGDPYREPAAQPPRRDVRDGYRAAIKKTASMTHDGNARSLAKKRGLHVLDLTWEDTGRFKGSAVGPNISDMTIQVSDALPGQAGRGATTVSCMPVIRFPNFSDKTADISLDDVFVRVGNERGAALRSVSLREYLRDLRRFLSAPSSWPGSETSLLAAREKDVLVSAQACFLPVPVEGCAEFNPVLFNYQSYKGAPAVLAIVATREGTSATIIDNQRDGFASGGRWGQRLFFNKNGERASFTGARLKEFVAAYGDETDAATSLADAKSKGLSCVMLIQIPLVQPERRHAFADEMQCLSMPLGAAAPAPRCKGAARPERSDVDEAVIGHGAVEGPFTEIDGVAIKRDPRFPIRITVQFYKATSNGVVEAHDIADIAAQIDAVYKDAKAVGSLVCEPDRGRSTEWDDGGAGKREPASWWAEFWAKQQAATGKTREQLIADLELLLGRRPSSQEIDDAIRRVFGV